MAFPTHKLILYAVVALFLSVLYASTQTFLSFFAGALLFSVPWWLPNLVVKARFFMFTAINGDEGKQFPSKTVGGDDFKWLYNHKAASIRSRQGCVGITDLFWYMLAPAHYIHQEHLENDNPAYALAAASTKKIVMSHNRDQLTKLARDYTTEMFTATKDTPDWRVVQLRKRFFPLFVRLFHEIIFEERCPEDVVDLMVRSGDNVIAALKFTTFRDMRTRMKATQYLMDRLAAGHGAKWFDEGMTIKEQALHLLGVFYHTACVQLSEAMAHLLICIAQYPEVQAELAKDDAAGSYLEMVMKEQMRIFPLFGVAHRIASEDIALPSGEVLSRGSVMLFNYQAFQLTGFDDPLSFKPRRWESLVPSHCNYIPFGVPRNRPCPGQLISQIWMKEITRVVLSHVAYATPVEHTRSLPCGGLCIEMRAGWKGESLRPLLTAYLMALDLVQGAGRSILQFFIGLFYLLSARRAQLAVRYFNQEDIE